MTKELFTPDFISEMVQCGQLYQYSATLWCFTCGECFSVGYFGATPEEAILAYKKAQKRKKRRENSGPE